MARASTALTAVRFALETSLGVAKASPSWLYPWCTAESIDPERQALQPRYLTNDRFLRPPVAGEYGATGTTSMIVGPENFHKFLYGMFSTVSTATDSGGVVTHSFTLGNTIPTLEMQAEKGYMETWNRGGFVRSAAFTVGRNSILTCDLTWQFQHQQIMTAGTFPASPTYSTLDPFTDMLGSITRDVVGGTTSATDMDGFTLNMDFGLLDFKRFGSQYITDVLAGKVDINWTLACAFTADTEFRRFLGDSTDTVDQSIGERFEPVEIVWTFQTGQDAGGYTEYPYLLKFTAYAGQYSVFPQGIPSDSEILRSNPVVMVRHSSGDSAEMQVQLRNTISNANLIL